MKKFTVLALATFLLSGLSGLGTSAKGNKMRAPHKVRPPHVQMDSPRYGQFLRTLNKNKAEEYKNNFESGSCNWFGCF